MIYLAQPYSHPHPEVQEERFEAGCEAVASLMNAGRHVFSPIAMSHPVAIKHNVPGDFEYWKSLDFDFIDRCDMVMVMTMDGWRESKGVQAEIEYAESKGKFVQYWYPGADGKFTV